MLFEVLKRRFSSSLPHPDMILIDGGKGQLSMALEVLRELKIEDVEARSIAKEKDFSPKENTPGAAALKLKSGSQISKGERVFIPKRKGSGTVKGGGFKADNLIISIRDEVHRRAGFLPQEATEEGYWLNPRPDSRNRRKRGERRSLTLLLISRGLERLILRNFRLFPALPKRWPGA